MLLISPSIRSSIPIAARFFNSLSNKQNPRTFCTIGRESQYRSNNISPIFRVSIARFSIMEGRRSGFSGINGGLISPRVLARSNGGAAERRASQFPSSPTSVVKIQMGDITKWFVDGSSDAIVNPANERMLGGGGADGAIHRAAGPELLAACHNVPEVRPEVRCPVGEARITPGFRLPASHVIHTAGPVYAVDSNPADSLKNAYRNSLRVARENNIQYVAFPAISCGVYGYPYDEAATVAISAVREFGNDIKEVHFVMFEEEIYNIWLNKADELLRDQ